MSQERIAVAMSGGVDSSVAALLLVREGFDVFGVHARMGCAECHLGPENQAPACGRDAAEVAAKLGFDFHIADLRQEFERRVVEPFVAEYRRGRTPNPCVICNPEIKLGALWEWAKARGAAALATGHYARVVRDGQTGRWQLRRAADPGKDQTYCLCGLRQEHLSRFRAPLGDLRKEETRRIAEREGLAVADKEESQDVCFVPDNDYRRFVASRLGADLEAGDPGGAIVDVEGRVSGRHEGIHRFTIGQRRGIGVGGAASPLYVVAVQPGSNTVVVGPPEALMAGGLEAGEVNWVSISAPQEPIRVKAKVRYRSPAAPALLTPLDGGRRVRLRFDSPQRAITPGQAAVFYDEADTLLLGGGVIEGVPHD